MHAGQRKKRKTMGIETLCERGIAGNAKFLTQRRNVFPGPGGTVFTEQDPVVSFRIPM